MPWAGAVKIDVLAWDRMPYSGIAREVSTRLKRVVPANAGTHIPEPVVMGTGLRGDDNQEFSAVRTCDRETSRRGRDRWAAVGSLARRMGCRADCPIARRLARRAVQCSAALRRTTARPKVPARLRPPRPDARPS